MIVGIIMNSKELYLLREDFIKYIPYEFTYYQNFKYEILDIP